MAITISCGQNPRPYATVYAIYATRQTGDKTKVDIKFDVYAEALNSPNYWGYGIKAQCFSDAACTNLIASIDMIGTATKTWGRYGMAMTFTVTNTNSAQTFYFRLTGLVAAGGCPGAVVAYPLSLPVYDTGDVYFGYGSSWKNCHAYFGYNGAWVPISVYFGKDGSWIQCDTN